MSYSYLKCRLAILRENLAKLGNLAISRGILLRTESVFILSRAQKNELIKNNFLIK